ncbi:MAG: tetratricopeptide repeat protein [Terriglobia bacterium]
MEGALELNPAMRHQRYDRYLGPAGRPEEALVHLQRAVELAPVPLGHRAQVAYGYLCASRFDKVIEQGKQVLELDPGSVPAHLYPAYTYFSMGRYEEAIAEAEKLAETMGENNHFVLQVKGWSYAQPPSRFHECARATPPTPFQALRAHV